MQRPPIGLRPADVPSQRTFPLRVERIKEVEEAIARYTEAGWAIPVEWSLELSELQRNE